MQLELRSVRIKNCGPIDDIKLDFFDAAGKTLPVCVIGGVNGSGKTTILESIVSTAEFLESHTLFNLHLARPDTYIQTDWRVDDNEISMFIGQIPQDAQLHKELCGVERHGSVGFPPRLTSLTSELRQRIGEQREWGIRRRSSTDIAPSLIYFPWDRIFEPITGEQLHKEEDRYQFVYRVEAAQKFEGSFSSYLVWLDYADPEQFQKIIQTLNNLDLNGKTFRVNRKFLSAVVRTPNGQEHLLHELSSGEQSFLIILVELRRKLTPGSVVLIDEIEASLHPAFQHQLAQGLLALQREIPYQLIVTTHAPAFVEIFGAENTRLLTAF